MDSKKEQIIQTALKRFSHYGFNKTTMSEIAMDLNITKANLYYYYPDKNALIKDVLAYISDEILTQQYAVLNQYDGSLLDVLCKLLEVKADFLKDYYVLHINENLEWIKGQGIGTLLEQFHQKNIGIVEDLLERATKHGEVEVHSIEEAATSYTEIMEGLSLIRSVSDMISGVPNARNVDVILESQKKATKFIFNNKIKEEN
ncbi:TetR/AcrR family transcriptional regulator [Sphingobacterium chuzhouense]|uniref:TetR/AcrR family transcriptional regulator n=1 Tax=Sphingobacterium chuzhouense TaxID=1742264 RepID=A0ABR7XU24_9SPHI|nr:TetR/AcrR family transcriptional regulator [Sphingobacterium chuzhouense]MBD1422374.1 TetR/AcrR family transcriptional regulator [Sphingobacterium chuzhouense]